MRETNAYAYKSYGQSLLWVASYFAVAVGLSLIIELVIVDFIHGNSHRTQENAVFMMVFFSPLFGVIAFTGALLVFTLPQFLQAMVVNLSDRLSWQRPVLLVIAILPITTALTWYCWEYLTPTDFNLGINEGADWKPYQHGITWLRYVKTFGLQAPVTLFSLLRHSVDSKPSRKKIMLITLAIVILAGGGLGYIRGRDQLRFL